MQREEFLRYLENVIGQKPATCQSRAGNCATLEKYEGDLDEAFALDEMQSLIDRLRYTKEDEREGRPARHAIPINGNIYNGTATLRNAANLYLSFKRGNALKGKRPVPTREGSKPGILASSTKESKDWPTWEQPTIDDSWLVAQVAMRYVRFLDPRIVGAVASDNALHCREWSEALAERGINPSLYLWEGSPCAFPGVRRHAGKQEIGRFRDKSFDYSEVLDALLLDDNDYPKHLWSFVFRNARFSKRGPEGYRLAHLIDHKEHLIDRMKEELVAEQGVAIQAIPGLYTCPSNTAYICGSLILPTDSNPQVRNLLARRAYELYGSCCNILPPGLRIKSSFDPGWETSDFEWSERVGTLDSIDAFLEYRAKTMAKLLASAQAPAAQ